MLYGIQFLVTSISSSLPLSSLFLFKLLRYIPFFYSFHLLNQDIIELLLKKGANEELLNNSGESVHTMSDVSKEIKALLAKK